MRKSKVTVVIWGFGAMGSGMAKMILAKQGFDIVGICDNYENYVNHSMFQILNIPNPYDHDVIITKDIDMLLDQTKPDIVLLATDSFTQSAYPKIKQIIEKGINVISTAEEMAYPLANEPELAASMDALAKKHGATILGTGVNPGMMMDLLAICMSGVMNHVKHMEISRINSLSPFGKTVMEEQGVGLSQEAFQQKCDAGEMAGHVGFKESVYMIANAIGVEVSSFKQWMKPIITTFDRKSPHGFAKKGHVCGVEMSAEATLSNGQTIKMYHPQQIEPEMAGIKTGDYIKIDGQPAINLANVPEVEGGLGTISICVNMIPHVINASPGLKTMIDLPVPRAIMGDVRTFIQEE